MTDAGEEATPRRLLSVAHLPRDFLDEVEWELHLARTSLVRSCERIASLEELLFVSLSTQTALGRPITVFDVVRSANDHERARRVTLVRILRSTE